MEQLVCENCQKTELLCVCQSLKEIKAKTQVLILQHPQEPDKQLGSAHIAHRSLPGSSLKVGLSWRNLEHALGKPANPKEWVVLYLGSVRPEVPEGESILLVDRKGVAIAESSKLLKGIKGLLVLDGTWSQAKALWWRNPWLLKLQRAVLNPAFRSLYGELRKEPRPDSVSTIEAIAIALSALERNPQIQEDLLSPFRELLAKAKAAGIRPPRRQHHSRGGRGRKRFSRRR